MSVPGLERGVAILRLFRRGRPCLSAPQIAAELAIPRSTLHRLLAVLVDLDLLRRTDDDRFALATGVLTLGHACLASLDVVGLADGVLADLRDATGWSTHLAIRRERSVVYLLRHASRAAVTTNITVGTTLPAHATLMGRMLLSALEPAALRSLYAGVELAARGPETPRTVPALETLIAADRERGYAVGQGFYERGVAAVAAPVRDRSLNVVAAINATAAINPAAAINSATTRNAATIAAGAQADASGTIDLLAVTTAVVRAANTISAGLGAPVGRVNGTALSSASGETSWV
jgi:DNA-binding IclR family transcriptional regulator